MRVYIAASYGRRAGLTEAECEKNVQTAIQAARILLWLGYRVEVPHLFHYIHKGWNGTLGEDEWLKMCIERIPDCDALVRLPGKSQGADNEVEEAKRLGIPVYMGLVTFLAMTHCGAKRRALKRRRIVGYLGL